MKNTAIEWAHHTFNPWIGCTKVSPACDHCYAENLMDSRMHVVQWGAGQPRKRTSVRNWNDPLRWNAEAERLGVRYRVFCASLADVFDNEVPPLWRQDLFELIGRTPHLDWLLLTKRIGNAKTMMADALSAWPGANRAGMIWQLPNVWLGATICNQAEAGRDIPKLLATPARVRFLSIEPLLGPIDLRPWLDRCDRGSRPGPGGVGGVMCAECGGNGHGCTRLDWVIVGGESGTHARPMHPDWVRSLRHQCERAEVAFLFKQWGEWGPDWEGAETCNGCGETKFDAINERGECARCGVADWFPASKPLDSMRHVGKKRAGRVLDGRTWDEVPE